MERRTGVLTAVLAAGFLAASLTACGGDQEPTGASSAASSGLKESGVLRSCAIDGLLPYSSSNTSTPGLEIEMADALAQRIGAKNRTVWVGTWDGLIPSLNNGECDAIIDGLFITDERKKSVDFTVPTWGSGEVIVVPTSDTTTRNLDDLKDKCVGALQGSVTVDLLKKAGVKKVKIYPTQTDVIVDLSNGSCAAGYLESPSAGWALNQEKDLKIKIVETYTSPEVFYEGIALKQGNDVLRSKLDTAIKAIQQDGTLAGILKKYGVPVYLPQ